MKKPYCHPELPYYAKGMCRNCYEKDLRKRNPIFAQKQKENCSEWVKKHKRWKALDDSNYQLRPDSKERKSLRKRGTTLASFGLTLDDETKLLEIQNFKCAICGGESGARWYHLDHDHETNEPRGLLCSKCNKGIGLLGDCLEGIERALKYLQNPPFKILKQNKSP